MGELEPSTFFWVPFLPRTAFVEPEKGFFLLMSIRNGSAMAEPSIVKVAFEPPS